MNHGGNVWQGISPDQWLDYSANIRPGGAPEWVQSALQAGLQSAAYYPDPEMKAARAALAEYLGLPAQNVLPTAGGISAIDLATRLISAGTRLITPCFSEYAQMSANYGAKILKTSILGADHALLSPARVLQTQLLPGETLWLCNPLNPVGVGFSRAELASLLELAEDRGARLIVDEAFIEYCPQNTVRDWVEDHPALLVTGSMTKILGIPGVRLGYLCANAAILSRLQRRQITWELNCFAEAVLRALPGHAEALAAEQETNARRREELARGLRELGLYVYPSAASFLLADFGRAVAPVEAQLKARGILVRNCMNFDGLADGWHLRLAVKDEKSNARLLTALREALSCPENR